VLVCSFRFSVVSLRVELQTANCQLETSRSLAIDLGNTYAKTGLFSGNDLLETRTRLAFAELIGYAETVRPDGIVVSSTARTEADFRADFAAITPHVLLLTPQTPVPLTKRYDTPHTLGADRVAAAVGAGVRFPGKNCVVIDLGTCITADYVDADRVFHGGLISPGLRMRFRAMQAFTQRLPLIEVDPGEPWPDLVGTSTRGAMRSGVLNGLVAELTGLIRQYREQFPDFQVVLCGGDAPVFESRLKESTFAVPELVLVGLHRILQHNAISSQQ
jgi:type III pantothenate kinase